MRIFGGEKIAGIMTLLKIPEEEAIEHQMVSRALEGAQVKVEGFYFDMRKRVVEYDDVMNKHRSVIYQLRDKILTESASEIGLTPRLKELITTELELMVNSRLVSGLSTKEVEMIVKEFVTIIPFDDASQKRLTSELSKTKDSNLIIKSLQDIATSTYESRIKNLGESVNREIEKYVYLTTLDEKWMDHLESMESLRDGIGLRGYAQRDPLVEYQKEAYTMFERLISSIESEVVHRIYRLNPVSQPPTVTPKPGVLRKDEVEGGVVKTKVVKAEGAKKADPKLGRNDPCWCGSGKKWKKCHYPATE